MRRNDIDDDGKDATGPAGDGPLMDTAGRMSPMNPVQLQQLLAGIDYPIDKADLLEAARQKGGDQNAIDALSKLPARRFSGPDDVSQAVGELG